MKFRHHHQGVRITDALVLELPLEDLFADLDAYKRRKK